jgi:hypothetical protein
MDNISLKNIFIHTGVEIKYNNRVWVFKSYYLVGKNQISWKTHNREKPCSAINLSENNKFYKSPHEYGVEM